MHLIYWPFLIINYYCFREIIDGIVVFDENNNPVGKSKKAAAKGITQVVISRIAMAAPGMSEFTLPFSIDDYWRNVHVPVAHWLNPNSILISLNRTLVSLWLASSELIPLLTLSS